MRENSEQKRTAHEAMAERASKGNRIALYNLCEMLAGDILFRTKYIVGSGFDAEGVTQDVLLRVCESIRELREPNAFKAWLGGILINEARQHISKSARHAAVTSIDDYTIEPVKDKTALAPDGQAENSAPRKSVMEAVSKLPLRQREAAMLHYYDGLAVAEVAKAMDISHQGVSRYLSLAQKRLAIELRKEKRAPDAGAPAPGPLGAAMSDAFQAMAADSVPVGLDWAQGALLQCQRQILASIPAT